MNPRHSTRGSGGPRVGGNSCAPATVMDGPRLAVITIDGEPWPIHHGCWRTAVAPYSGSPRTPRAVPWVHDVRPARPSLGTNVPAADSLVAANWRRPV